MAALVEPILAQTGPFRSFGEQLRAIRSAAIGSRSVDQRLLQVRAAAGGSEQVPGDGGFLVQPEFSREIVKRMYLTGEIFRRCTKMPMSTNGVRFPQFDESSRVSGSRLGGIQVYLENEAASLQTTALATAGQTQKPAFQLSELVPNKFTGLLYLTDELSSDSNAMEAWANYAFSQELTFKLETTIVNGDGAGQPLGIMNSGALITVAAQAGQATKTIVNPNVIDMVKSLWAPSRKNAVWLYNQDTLDSLMQLTTVVGIAGSQSNLFQFQSTEDDYDRLCGIPASPSEYCKSVGTTGDLILADFSRYMIGMREELRAEISIHLLFLTDQNAFRFIMRATGQPIDNRPVTPANGTIQTSPFICLQSR